MLACRGRRNPEEIEPGDTIDFWRVLIASKDSNPKRLLLYAEMKVPGEAWLEFKIVEENGKKTIQTHRSNRKVILVSCFTVSRPYLPQNGKENSRFMRF